MQEVARVAQIRVIKHDVVVVNLVHNKFDEFSWSQFQKDPNLRDALKPELIKIAELFSMNPQALGSSFLLYCDIEPIDLTSGGQSPLH